MRPSLLLTGWLTLRDKGLAFLQNSETSLRVYVQVVYSRKSQGSGWGTRKNESKEQGKQTQRYAINSSLPRAAGHEHSWDSPRKLTERTSELFIQGMEAGTWSLQLNTGHLMCCPSQYQFPLGFSYSKCHTALLGEPRRQRMGAKWCSWAEMLLGSICESDCCYDLSAICTGSNQFCNHADSTLLFFDIPNQQSKESDSSDIFLH